MKLLFRKNNILEYDRQSGQICPGLNRCLYFGSVTRIEIIGCKDELNKFFLMCPFLKYVGSVNIRLSDFTKAELEKYQKKHNLCYHPNELTHIREWRCYKCNACVKSKRERHNCNNFFIEIFLKK